MTAFNKSIRCIKSPARKSQTIKPIEYVAMAVLLAMMAAVVWYEYVGKY